MPSRRFLSTVLLGAALATSCGSPATTPAPQPAPIARPDVPADVDSLHPPWIPSVTAGTFTHEIRLEATIEARVDTVVRADTVRSVVGAEWSRVAGAAVPRLSGLLTRFGVSRDTAPPVMPPGLLLPLPFAAIDGDRGAQVRFGDEAAPPCDPSAAAMQALREVFVTLPPRLEPGTTWGDSARYRVCRDSVVLEVSSVRQFRLVGAERRGGDIVVLLDRSSRTTLAGEGVQFGESISISAEGEGQARLGVRLAGAVIIEGHGASQLRMTLQGRRRLQKLRQDTRMEILTP